MYFVIRDGRYHDMTHITFRQFMDGAAHNSLPDGVPTIGDWANHLSTLFPDVRLKRFLEMRGADGGPWRRICALPAFWVGLLYDDEALDAAETLTADWTYEEVLAMRDAVPAGGIATRVPQHQLARDRPRGARHLARSGSRTAAARTATAMTRRISCRRSTRSSRAAPPAPRKCSTPTTRAGAARSSRRFMEYAY